MDSTARTEPSSSSLRHCVACGYSLQGLPEPARCPECGLLNVPDAFRRQIWALIDSGKWFFSSPTAPWRQRLYGWWWSLDRDGDMRRSFRFAAAHCVCAVVIVGLGVLATSAIRVQSLHTYYVPDPARPTQLIDIGNRTAVIGLGGSRVRAHGTTDMWTLLSSYGANSITATTVNKVIFEPNMEHWFPMCGMMSWLVATWFAPAVIGMWTQIRRGLPEYARAPRTIIAAGNYEAHKITYLALVICMVLFVDVAARCSIGGPALPWKGNPLALLSQVLTWFVLLYAALGWVGPVRSDYTRQLVRSRFHAMRILVMYAFACPWVFMVLTMGLVVLIAGLFNVTILG